MKKNERIIQFFDIGIFGGTRSRDLRDRKLAAPRTLNELMKEFMILRDLNLARNKISPKSKQEYRLEDMVEKPDCWVLMINVVDTDASHPVTQKVSGTALDREVIALGNDRGLESSSHLIIYKDKNAADKHLCLFEQNSPLPFRKAIAFLRKLCRVSAKQHSKDYKLPHPSDEGGKIFNIYCDIGFYAHPSEEFIQELDEGVIKGIRLTSEMDAVKGYDVNKYPELLGADIKMSASRWEVMKSGGNWKHLQKAITYADSLDSPFVRVSFQDASGASHTAELSSDTSKLTQSDKYVKKRKIEGFGNALLTAFPIIHNEIVEKMQEILTK